MSDANKIKYGLKNVRYAKVTEAGESIEYGDPIPIRGAVNLTLDAAGEEVAFYADDHAYFEENTNNGYEGSLEVALIPDQFRVDILGDVVDANGALIENKDAKVSKFALLFEFDGDKNRTRHVLYSVLPERPSVTGSTRTETKTPQTETMNIKARPAVDTGDVKAKVPQSESDTYTKFYESVYLADQPVNALDGLAPEFAINAPDDVEFELTSTSKGSPVANSVRRVLLNGKAVPAVSLVVDELEITILQAYLEAQLKETGQSTITVELELGSPVDVPLTVTST
ncbi:MAG: hypothetical protein GX878_11600 [Firmicutes bacterium]|nr:hypothetical protein [Bacillota bacterium]